MSRNYTGQEGAAHEGLTAKVVPATLTGGFYAYVVTNGSHRYISGPHATSDLAARDANEWIDAEIRRHGHERRALLEKLKLHAGEHPAITDEQIETFRRELGSDADRMPAGELNDCDHCDSSWTLCQRIRRRAGRPKYCCDNCRHVGLKSEGLSPAKAVRS